MTMTINFMIRAAGFAALLFAFSLTAMAQDKEAPKESKFDAELAKRLGADKMGMRSYVLVILKTGPKRVPDGPERDEMFKGHFANMGRLAKEGKLVLAGPLDRVDGWRGLYIFNTADIEEAKRWTETDPVIIKGEMIGEYHKYYGSAALMMVNEIHEKVAETSF